MGKLIRPLPPLIDGKYLPIKGGAQGSRKSEK